MTAIAQLEHVSIDYGANRALCDVSIALSAGETLALLGPNGAGKTTAIGLLTGLKRVQHGRASLFGMDPRTPGARRAIGATPQEAAFPPAMRVGEILDFVRSHYPEPVPRDEIVSAFQLGDLTGRMAVELSGGQQRNLAVALAFAGGPRIVFLDEPTTGLDAAARKRIWAYVAKFTGSGGSVFLTTHNLEEAEAVADRIVLLNRGNVEREGSVAKIKAAVGFRILRFSAAAPPGLFSARLRSREDGRYTYVSEDADQTVRELVALGVPFSSLEVLPASLEDAIDRLLEMKR